MSINDRRKNPGVTVGGLSSMLLAVFLSSAPGQNNGPAANAGSDGVTVTINHNGNDAAGASFKFEAVPTPSKLDAATTARFAIVDGEVDANSGGFDTLHDGQLPSEEDQPSANFFFNAGTDGGRFSIDLGKAISIKAVNTYSWHPSSRGPQVYKLYASDGSASAFNPAPKRGTDPEACGWKLVANVDARVKQSDIGGQYGVGISGKAGPIGSFRYLLFDCSKTESDDEFGNTFYSEIDVIDADPSSASAGPAGGDASLAPLVVKTADGSCEITIETAAAPKLREWAGEKLAPVLADWYPKIVALLPSDGFTAPARFKVTLKPMDGVAYTGGTHVTANSTWLESEIGKQAVGALVHEEVHVVQQYGHARRNNPNATRSPGWLVEGMADYIRWFKYEPESHGADIVWMRHRRNFTPRYDAGYRVSANFLDWVTDKYDSKLVTQMNAAMRDGKYSEELWKQDTGKTLSDLGDEWKKEIEAKLATPPPNENSKPGV